MILNRDMTTIAKLHYDSFGFSPTCKRSIKHILHCSLGLELSLKEPMWQANSTCGKYEILMKLSVLKNILSN